MKTFLNLSFLALSFFASTPSFATGGFSCAGKTETGDQVEISACVPHGILGVCSDVRVSLNEKQVLTIPRDQVAGIFWGDLKDSTLFAVTAYDSDFNKTILDLVYQYTRDNQTDELSTVYSRMNITIDKKQLSIKGVTCDFE